MKCPECPRNHKYSDGMQCTCGYQFVFNPKASKLRDRKFTSAVRRVSRDGTRVYTQNQLYASYIRRTNSRVAPWVAGILGLASIPTLCLMSPIGIVLAIVSFLVFANELYERRNPLKHDVFSKGVRQWLDKGRTLEGMLTEPMLEVPPEDWPEEDIYDYGVERILIVQRPLLVDLLVKNNQHAEQRMLIISESGYPSYLQDRTNQLLAQRSDLPVFLLHDADQQGGTMAERIRSLEWLQLNDNPVIDLGFFQSDFEKLKRTKRVRRGMRRSDLPVDALLMGSLSLGLSQCFLSRSTFAQELQREIENEMRTASSFG